MMGAASAVRHDVIMPGAARQRIAQALAMLRGKTGEMPGCKYDDLSE